MNIKQISPFEWELEREGSMNVPVRIYASKSLLEGMKKDRTLQQIQNVASLPNVKEVRLMPDGHEGYGFPIGGVAAFSREDGLVSPGGIGYDINCGVRLLKTELTFSEIKNEIGRVVSALFKAVPSGVGSKGMDFTKDEFLEIVSKGMNWAVQEGYATKKDAKRMEESGVMETSPDFLSQKAISRGMRQLGTLGAGNHFLEMQKVERVYQDLFDLRKGQVAIMIHTGSRGFGHQIASDYVAKMVSKFGSLVKDKELAAAPLNSKEASEYLSAMKAAVNFAFVNRQLISYHASQVFEDFFGVRPELIYDVAHNIGKFEGDNFIHRKGATRAFGPGDDLPEEYKKTGQPVIIPGSMGTASYLLRGLGNTSALKTTCHGAGRLLSRSSAKKTVSSKQVKSALMSKGIILRAKDPHLISEEAPEAYKDIDAVIETVVKADIVDKVARLVPLGVVKG